MMMLLLYTYMGRELLPVNVYVKLLDLVIFAGTGLLMLPLELIEIVPGAITGRTSRANTSTLKNNNAITMLDATLLNFFTKTNAAELAYISVWNILLYNWSNEF